MCLLHLLLSLSSFPPTHVPLSFFSLLGEERGGGVREERGGGVREGRGGGVTRREKTGANRLISRCYTIAIELTSIILLMAEAR